MNKRIQQFKYLFFDYLGACVSWFLLFQFRKTVIEQKSAFHLSASYLDSNFYIGLGLIPVFWIVLYFILEFYAEPYRKSRLKEFFQTLSHTLFGVLIIFFVVLLDDVVDNYTTYYYTVSFYALVHFLCTYIPRFILSSITVQHIQNRIIGFNTLIVGSSDKALDLITEIQKNKVATGFNLKGFVHLNVGNASAVESLIPHLGAVKDIGAIIDQHHIEDVIIALESAEHDAIKRVLDLLKLSSVQVKIIPDLYQILSGQVKMNSILGVPLIEINQEIIPKWQLLLKRTMDVLISCFVLLVFSPLYLFLALMVKMTSKGPVFYWQERIGKKGKPFLIFKYRSMFTDAEQSTPILAKEDDPRVTKFGRFLRKTRLDEIPQFFNVLIGDMSLVGPRPERAYFIEKIVEKAPHYTYLQRIRPGITSWGQVKYGYASDVDEMIERLKYDVLYLENMSIMVDLKILIHTVMIVLQGRGK
jgi:exopolysaccharide biosynthesis polyprenyl glycosylphosphotransferase